MNVCLMSVAKKTCGVFCGIFKRESLDKETKLFHQSCIRTYKVFNLPVCSLYGFNPVT